MFHLSELCENSSHLIYICKLTFENSSHLIYIYILIKQRGARRSLFTDKILYAVCVRVGMYKGII